MKMRKNICKAILTQFMLLVKLMQDVVPKWLCISVKLSAIHPRYVRAQRDRVMSELFPA